jgi:hypothetical protein
VLNKLHLQATSRKLVARRCICNVPLFVLIENIQTIICIGSDSVVSRNQE